MKFTVINMKRLFLFLPLIAVLSVAPLMAQQASDTTEAKVTIVKYSDYQCPACKYFVDIEEQLKKEYGSDLEIITKHFPLRMHQYALLAARAVEAAREQGKYEEMHHLIFDGQEQWARGNAEGVFIGYARSLELDMDKFMNDWNSAQIQQRVLQQKQEGLDKEVNSTPTFFINGDKIDYNPRTVAAFKSIVDRYMN